MSQGKTREETISDMIQTIPKRDDHRLYLLEACLKGLTKSGNGK